MFLKKNIFFILILLIGIFFRFYQLTWGAPFFFHPDENNITNAILQLSLSQWNPHFFAYGGLPIYTTFLLTNTLAMGKQNFATAAYMLRFFSALLSLLLIPSLFFIGKKLYNREVGMFAALLASVSIGFIQFAHFGTFEMWLTFFTLWFFYFCYLLWKKYSLKYFFLVCLLTGILMSIKVSSIIFLPIPVLILLLQNNAVKQKIAKIIFYSLIVIIFYMLTNPFLLLDTQSFLGALHYESSVAVGTFPVFYTQSFLNTTPVLYQLQHVLPFLLNPIVFCVSLISFFLFLFSFKKQRKSNNIFLLLFLLLTFFSQSFLFVKWTRYMVPTLPFFYLVIAVGLQQLTPKMRRGILAVLFGISFILSVAFLHIAYSQDSRITASSFAKSHTTGKLIIMEPYDLGALVFNPYFPNAKTVDIYNLEQDPLLQENFQSFLSHAVYIISPSQRLIHSRLANPQDFPKGNMLYKNLLNGSEGFRVIYQTPCDMLCSIIYLGNPIQGSVEETATVFDHPFVTIFAKQ